MTWKSATFEEVRRKVEADLAACSPEQVSAFLKYAVQPYAAPLIRYGRQETVIVVARKATEVIYWEDVEEGFNLSPIDAGGCILEHRCNQDCLGLALNTWIENRAG